MTDLSIGDIAADTATSGAAGEAAKETAEAAAKEAASGESTAEWMFKLVDRMEERGYLGPLLFGPEGVKEMQGSAPAPAGEGNAEATGGGTEISAETIADIGKEVIDHVGDRKLSEVVAMCEQRPQQVNMLIDQKLGEDDEPEPDAEPVGEGDR